MDSYDLWRMFFSWITKMFFSEIHLIGKEYIPHEGPIVFVGNHQNQFMDPLLILTHCGRKLGFLIAAKSMTRFVVGYFAKQLGTIPVHRAQDAAVAGKGMVRIVGTKVIGENTSFVKDFQTTGASFSCPGESEGIRVVSVTSDTEMELGAAPALGNVDSVKYKVIPKLDQAKVYESVWQRLGEGGCIGIFPEGGSHDRANLLPLKAGVSIMALGAMAKYKDLEVSIVPCGLNYWSGHRFRSTVVIEFGKPYKIPLALAQQYAEGQRRESCGELLEITESLMRAVTFNCKDFETRRMIQTIRHLYVPATIPIPVDKYMELTRKLAKGYEQTQHEPDVVALSEEVTKYSEELNMVGVTDDHVASEDSLDSTIDFIRLVTLRVIALLGVLIFALPGLILNAPIGLIARIVASRQAKKAKAGSVVKIAGTDVVASYKVIIGMVVTPVLYALYAITVMALFGFWWFLLFTICWPLFSWASIRVLEEGVRIWKSFLLLFRIQLWASELKSLRNRRKHLSAQVRTFGLRVAPEFAPERFEQSPATQPRSSASFKKNKGYLSKKDEFRSTGLRLNESYESLEMSLMESDGHL